MFAKLFSSITESSLWSEPKEVRLLFVTMLAKADADGFVEASIPGLARVANLTIQETESGLECLQSPDPYSKNPDNEGRRVLVVPGGFLLLNYEDYRSRRNKEERREYMRQYMREYRKQSSQPVNNVSHSKPQLSQAEAEAEAEAENDIVSSKRKANTYPDEFEEFWDVCHRRKDKGKALKAWEKALKIVSNETLIKAMSDYTAEQKTKGTESQYIKLPATWLNSHSWEDEPDTQLQPTASVWPKIVSFLSRDDLSQGYSERLTSQFGESVTKAIKAVGAQKIAQANEFQLSTLSKQFEAEMKA